jgi:outer membrane lipoprotein-sorting protein
MMMRPFFFLVAGLWLWTISPASAQNAAEILAKAADAYSRSNGMTAPFTLHTRSEMQQTEESLEGVIQMRGNKFTLTTPGAKTWYDGATQWTYIEQTEEVNISTPEGDELLLTSPAILLGSYRKDFTATYKGQTAAASGKAVHIIELAPRKNTPVARVELQIEQHSSLPVCIRVEMKNNIQNTIRIGHIKTGVNQPDAFFTFPQADYPHAEIVDLR